MKRLARVLVVTVSALLGLVALLLLFVVPVTVSFVVQPDGEASVNCGTAFNGHPISLACPDAQSARQTWSFGLLALGVVGVAGGFVVPRVRARR